MKQFGGVYRGCRVLVTGHTGFKGSWLCTWLKEMGAQVTGFALPPATTPSHWDLLQLSMPDLRGDVRGLQSLQTAVNASKAEIVFHLAAQPLVRRSYRDPLESWSTNVMGTVNLLEACRAASGVRAIVVITTDKVYSNQEWPWGYRETDKLGGYDPYSASKAGAELVVESYRSSFFSGANTALVASARAGNVIGGGDWSEDRLVPDIVRSVASGSALEIRSPLSTRSWLHVLDCLSGYLMLGQELLTGKREFAQAWNFGPGPDDNRSVTDVLDMLQGLWPALRWESSTQAQPHETALLFLDSSKARSRLKWKLVWDLKTALAATAHWYREQLSTGKPLTKMQLGTYVEAAAKSGAPWAQ